MGRGERDISRLSSQQSGGGGQWQNLGAASTAGQSLVLYAGPNGGTQHCIVFTYPILPGDAFKRMDDETLYLVEPECGDEFTLCFLDETACTVEICGAIFPERIATRRQWLAHGQEPECSGVAVP
ncbi:hypothetical protein E2562_023410 [Oryza meyeriana var. granulata]|uniref:Uncharacterized protein n=1 Tax=Oryza meyeriana var. granulata TaxID=110450 RepID=A0A6G1FB46_9ORYZ|nr:hypothetical protein E2562_023410 [Oryza meyeriana var. granulata]